MGKSEDKLRDGAAEFLEAGESILAAAVVAARGHTQAVAGVRSVGLAQQRAAMAAGERAELVVHSPMGLAITDKRLLSLEISNGLGMGIGLKVKGLMSAVPLDAVDGIEVKKLISGKKLVVTMNGEEIAMEAGAGANVSGIADAFESARATA